MTVRQMLASMDSAEYTHWMAFCDMEPFGEDREDLRAGIVAAAVGNHGFMQPKRPYRPLDFMPLQLAESQKPILLDDPEKQSALIMGLLNSASKKSRMH